MPLDPLRYAVPVFAALIAAEIVWSSRVRRPGVGRNGAYETRDTALSLLIGLGSTVTGVIGAGFVAGLLSLAAGLAPWPIGRAWWAWPVCFVADDLAYYWFHRSAHRVRWFWASHVNHHSSQHYNLSTALRQSWTALIALAFVFRLPLALAGFDPAMILACAAFNLIYQFWIHTEVIGRMPRWFEAVMNTPSHHRVHHAINPAYLDRNYGGALIVWDRLFGTFAREDDATVIHYGIVHQLGSFDLLRAVFHEWIAIARDVACAPWRHKLGYIWREPGWSHDGSRETSAMIRRRVSGERS